MSERSASDGLGVGMAVLRDERDLLWIVLDDVRSRGTDRLCDLHFLARDEPLEPPRPFVSVFGVAEPVEALRSLAEGLRAAAEGEVRALRHDPVQAGLSIEIKSVGGDDPRFEVVAWLDLLRMNDAMRARAARGRHQAGLRMFVRADALRVFAGGLLELTA